MVGVAIVAVVGVVGVRVGVSCDQCWWRWLLTPSLSAMVVVAAATAADDCHR